MGRALGQRTLRYIDPEIRDLVSDINRLPYVLCTLSCCAGIGKRYDGERGVQHHAYHHRPNFGMEWHGWVLIVFSKRPCWQEHRKHFTDEIFNSDLYATRATDLRRKWKRVHEKVRQELRKFGRL